MSNEGWPAWRGSFRDARVPYLPDSLAPEPAIVWELPLLHSGLGGIAATQQHVVFGDRDVNDFHDVFRCLDAENGNVIWEVQRLAIAALDYGNSPRATPLIHKDHVFCLSAHGLLMCVGLQDGSVVWEKNLREEFKPAGDLPWGYCGSPFIVDGRLIVNPGATNASLVAMEPGDGTVLWKTPGAAQGYGSFIVARLGGRKQIVGHDAVSLGGWDVVTGERLWTVTPELPGDFNVPTPLVVDGRLLVATENNGTRLFDFAEDGRIDAIPAAQNKKLRPDMSTPVSANGHVYCVNRFLYCLDASDDLREVWRLRDRSFGDYAAMFVGDNRILVVGKGELLLLGTDGTKQVLSRQRILKEDLPIYSHPAIVGRRIYIRGEKKLICAELK